jgi:cell division protein FtsQ
VVSRVTPLAPKRQAAARQQRHRRSLVVALALLPVCVLVLVAFSPLLDVDTVRVSGNKRVAAAVIRNVGGVHDGDPLVTVDLDAVRHRIARLPAVKSVTVRRSWPSTVVVTVVERVPVVAVRRPGRFDLYDLDGVPVETVTVAPPGTPVLTVPGEPTRAVVTATVDLMRALTPNLRKIVSGLRADANGSLSFRLADGAEVIWGDAERTAEKVKALRLLVLQHARRYDLRVPDHPAVVPR